MQQGSEGNTIQSVDRTLQIIQFLLENDGATIAEVAEEMQLANSTAFRYLKSLEKHGYVVCEDHEYNLGLPFLQLSKYVRERKKEFILSEPIVEELASTTGERCQFYVLENNSMIAVYRKAGERAVLTNSEVGKRVPLYPTSAGKAVLAMMPEERTEEILSTLEFDPYTANTITDSDEFRKELARIRESSVSYNMEEYIDGLVGISIPITDSNGRVAGSLTVSGPAERLTKEYLEENILDTLLGLANELELKIRYE